MPTEQVLKKICESDDKHIRTVRKLFLRIWNIEDLDWKILKTGLEKFKSGILLINTLQSLPYFEEIRDGDYQKLKDTPSNPEFQDVIKEWERVDKSLEAISEDWLSMLEKII